MTNPRHRLNQSDACVLHPSSTPPAATLTGLDVCGPGHKCQHTCVSSGDSYHCRCRRGYELNLDGKTCSRKNRASLRCAMYRAVTWTLGVGSGRALSSGPLGLTPGSVTRSVSSPGSSQFCLCPLEISQLLVWHFVRIPTVVGRVLGCHHGLAPRLVYTLTR